MKKIVLYLFISFLLASCINDISNINVNPNKTISSPPEYLLNSAIRNIAKMVDGQYNAKSMVWAQYWTNGNAENNYFKDIERYSDEFLYSDSVWQNAYLDILPDLYEVEKSDNKFYSAISKILISYVYQGLVDHFGDIPYFEAVKGDLENGSIFYPKFDNGKEIYLDLINKIEEGINLLRNGGGEENNDIIYKGNHLKWIKFGNSLELRLLLRISDVVNVKERIVKLIEERDFIESESEMAIISYDEGSGVDNPMYTFLKARGGNAYIASLTLFNILHQLNDLRLGAYYSKSANTGCICGIEQGGCEPSPFLTPCSIYYSQMTDKLYSQFSTVILFSNWETWLLRAESAVKFSTIDDDKLMFENGVQASFNYLNLELSNGYLEGLNFEENKLDAIVIQKWISMNGLQDDEAWIESKRFDIFNDSIFETPKFSVLDKKVFPGIWLYPSQEITYNPNTPSGRKITDKVFWDK